MALGISKHFTFKPLICLLNVIMFQFTTCCPMTYDTLLPAGFTCSFQTRATLPCLPPTRFCFSGRQKSDGKQTSSIAIFGLSVGLCELQLCLVVCVGKLVLLPHYCPIVILFKRLIFCHLTSVWNILLPHYCPINS